MSKRKWERHVPRCGKWRPTLDNCLLYPDSHFLQSERNDSGLATRAGGTGTSKDRHVFSRSSVRLWILLSVSRNALKNISQGYSEPSEETHIAVSNGCLMFFPWECRLPYSKTFPHLVTHRHFPWVNHDILRPKSSRKSNPHIKWPKIVPLYRQRRKGTLAG